MGPLAMLYPDVPHEQRSPTGLLLLIPGQVPYLQYGVPTPFLLADADEQTASLE